jgi:tetratricopeptide (TPR) repeat protein
MAPRISGIAIYCAVLTIVYLTFGCSHSIPRFGIGGRYLEGKDEVTKGRFGDVDKAILALEEVVRQDPTYQDSLTLLGRAYYKKGRYRDALEILKRASAVNSEDEIAWIAVGLTQLRLGDDQRGLESLKGGVTLLNKVSIDGYKGIGFWDKNGSVRIAIRQSVFLLMKEVEAKEEIIRSGEVLLARIDDEIWRGQGEERLEATTSGL